jgi:FKBP-type peptidyl-prolyl cis-trans isomerase SlyD
MTFLFKLRVFTMLIDSPCVVNLTLQLHDAQGQLIYKMSQPKDFFYGGNELFEKVEAVLLEEEAGFHTQIFLEPEEAFGVYLADWVFFEDRSIFPQQLEIGMQFEGVPPQSQTPNMPTDLIYRVTEIYSSHVVLDGNHPLAGIGLWIDIEVHSVREATEVEIEAGETMDDEFVSVLNSFPAPQQLQ